MLKLFCLKALQLIVVTLLLLQMAVGVAWAQEIQSPQKTSLQSTEIKKQQEETLPARQEQTTDDRKTTKSSQKEPETVSPTQPSKSNRPVDPYGKYYEGMKKFNEELYGKDG
jgi:hypothetical protein